MKFGRAPTTKQTGPTWRLSEFARPMRNLCESSPRGLPNTPRCSETRRPVEPLIGVPTRRVVVVQVPAHGVHPRDLGDQRVGLSQIRCLLLARDVVEPAECLVLGVPAELVDEDLQVTAWPDAVEAMAQPVEVVEVDAEATLAERHLERSFRVG